MIGKRLNEELQNELHLLLSWWMEHMIDHDNGGFYGRIDGQGRLHPEAPKSIILNTRILWTFAAAARQTGQSQYREIADRAYDYLMTHFWDNLDGGMFWMLDYKGQPTQTKKQIYAQAFALYALSEYQLLTGKKEVLTQAHEVFWLIEKFSKDKKQGGYFEAFSREWQPLEDLRLSEKDANEAKTMNTHLHVMEAYTNFYRVHQVDSVGDALRSLIELFLEKFIVLETGHLHLFFDETWNLKSDEISFGHDIECSWLIWEAIEVLEDEKLIARVRPVILQMADSTLKKGLSQDGGLFNEATPNGLSDTDFHWWPQAEAVVGFWNAFEISGKNQFAEAANKNWSFIKEHLRDKKNGEWHWRLNEKKSPILSEDKAGPWKAPYHNGRMCLEIMRRISTRQL